MNEIKSNLLERLPLTTIPSPGIFGSMAVDVMLERARLLRKEEWKYVARVTDRITLYFFLVIYIFSILLLSVPHFERPGDVLSFLHD